MAQWLRICLPTQAAWVWSLVREDPTCHGATKPMHHNYWACTLEPASHNYWVHAPQLPKPACLKPVLCNKRSSPLAATRGSPHAAMKTQHSQKWIHKCIDKKKERLHNHQGNREPCPVTLWRRVPILESSCRVANPASHPLPSIWLMPLGKSFNTLSPSFLNYKMVIIIAFTFMIFVTIEWHKPCKVSQCLAHTKYSANCCYY